MIVELPGHAIYLDENNRIIINSYTFSSAGMAEVRIIMRNPEGEIVPSLHRLAYGGIETLTESIINTGPGHLISVSLRDGPGSIAYGVSYARATLCRLENGTPRVMMELCAGYITDIVGQTWPSLEPKPGIETVGPTPIVTPTDPAAGANLSHGNPSQAQYEISCVKFRLTTSATVATRRVQLRVTLGGVVVAVFPCSTTQAESLVYDYVFSANGAAETFINSVVNYPIPKLEIPSGGGIDTSIVNLQAGDDISLPRIMTRRRIGV